MHTIENKILNQVNKRDYRPVKPKVLARKLGLSAIYDDFKRVLRGLVKQGRIEFGNDHAVRPVGEHGTVAGVFRKGSAGFGFVRPHVKAGELAAEIYIPEGDI